MEKGFYLLAKKVGSRPPSHVHKTIESAMQEARRLHNELDCEIQILEIVGGIKKIEVPVTRIESKMIVEERLLTDDLPF